MRHLQKGRKLNRSPAHLLALKRNMAARLIAHERIVTTVPKAKELRSFTEKLITIAKRGAAFLDQVGKDPAMRGNALHCRRLLIARLGGKKTVIVKNDEINVINKLLNDLGPRFISRQGGYTRIIKQTTRRLGDASPTAIIELIGSQEPNSRPKRKKKQTQEANA